MRRDDNDFETKAVELIARDWNSRKRSQHLWIIGVTTSCSIGILPWRGVLSQRCFRSALWSHYDFETRAVELKTRIEIRENFFQHLWIISVTTSSQSLRNAIGSYYDFETTAVELNAELSFEKPFRHLWIIGGEPHHQQICDRVLAIKFKASHRCFGAVQPIGPTSWFCHSAKIDSAVLPRCVPR